MARQSKPLSHTQISKAKAKNKLYRLYDGNGLCLKITKNGSKIWEYRFKNPETLKDDTYIIGDYPAISLAMAREKHIELRRLVIDGKNPKRETADIDFISMFEESFEVWAEGKTTKTQEEAKRLINKYAKKHIGHLPVDKIQPTHIMRVMDEVVASGNLSLPARLLPHLRRTFRHCITRKGVIQYDPTYPINLSALPQHKSISHESLKLDQIFTLHEYFKNGRANSATKNAVELALRNIARIQEIVMLKWEYIDFKNMIMNVPDEVMKMKKPHQVPITNQTLKILEAQKNSSEWVFPSRSKLGHMHYSTPTASLRKNNIASTSHGFRHLASTFLNEARKEDGVTEMFSEHLVEKALAHASADKIRATYNLSDYKNPRKIMAQYWSDFIDKCDTKENNEKALKEVGISLI